RIIDYLISKGFVKDPPTSKQKYHVIRKLHREANSLFKDLNRLIYGLNELLGHQNLKNQKADFAKILQKTLNKYWDYKEWEIFLETLKENGIGEKDQLKLIQSFFEMKKSGELDKKFFQKSGVEYTAEYRFLRNHLLICCLLTTKSYPELKEYIITLIKNDLSQEVHKYRESYIQKLNMYLKYRAQEKKWKKDIQELAEAFDVEIIDKYPMQELF
ncbi:MAG: hypothetical protein AAF696_37575, partial [Bacteroidota bacterium]